MDPFEMKMLKRVAAKIGTVEGPLARLKKIHLVSCSCPSARTARAEGVVMVVPSDPPLVVAPMMC